MSVHLPLSVICNTQEHFTRVGQTEVTRILAHGTMFSPQRPPLTPLLVVSADFYPRFEPWKACVRVLLRNLPAPKLCAA